MARTDPEPTTGTPTPAGEALYFFPDRETTEEEAREILRSGPPEKRAWVISNLLRFAQWDDIWTYVDREEVCAIFDQLELPDKLKSAWARMLKIETPVG